MPLWTHKVLIVPFLPLGFCFWTVLLGLVLRRRWLAWMGAGVLLLSSLGVVGDRLLVALEDSYPPVSIANCPAADAIVVLGGMVRQEAPAGALEWNDSADRFERGIELFQAGKAPVIAFTAARIAWRPEVTEGELLRGEALRRGLTAEQVAVTSDRVENTAGEARAIKSMMGQRGWRHVILVTSAFHMRRSMQLMRSAGVECTPFPSDYQARRLAPPEAADFLPQAESLAKTERVLREWFGILFYAVRGK
ncbi:YdcF family protein [Paludibaculum fermentans]|uniref:YdcF family protein n=1 Tax=Paludibaculum fermentans TaxID=1473598 RepID=A0A7S7SI57_PALFE|nr:YdcF family protein [Paludibaculum fermentans]QOY85086.1 YdcF family protein [Paludibaculum fermentans]